MSGLFAEGRHACEYRFRRKDGSYCWVNDEQILVRDAAGEPLEVVGSWSDIGARKAAEAAEAHARARLNGLLESAPSVIYSFKAHGDFAPTFVSENIKRLLGYCPEKYLEYAGFLARAGASRRSRFRRGRAGEAVRDRQARKRVPLSQAERHLYLGKRRAISHARRRTASRQRSSVRGATSPRAKRPSRPRTPRAPVSTFCSHGAPAVVYSFKASGDYAPTFISDNIKRVLGYEPDEYLKNPISGAPACTPRTLPQVEAAQAKLFEEGRARRRIPLPQEGRRLLLGQRRAASGAATSNGNPLEVIGSWSEVTARKTAEQAALAESEQRLTDAIETDLGRLLALRQGRPPRSRQLQIYRAIRSRRRPPETGRDLRGDPWRCGRARPHRGCKGRDGVLARGSVSRSTAIPGVPLLRAPR